MAEFDEKYYIDEVERLTLELKASQDALAAQKASHDAVVAGLQAELVKAAQQVTEAALALTASQADSVAKLAAKDADIGQLKVLLYDTQKQRDDQKVAYEARIAELGAEKQQLKSEVDALQDKIVECEAKCALLEKSLADIQVDARIAGGALSAAKDELQSQLVFVDISKVQLEAEKRAQVDLLNKVAALSKDKAALELELGKVRAKFYFSCGKQQLMVMNASPQDMDFVERKRPWVAEKLQQGVYLLKIANDGAPQAELDALGYQQRLF
jgi:chromosome segregation ATPase